MFYSFLKNADNFAANFAISLQLFRSSSFVHQQTSTFRLQKFSCFFLKFSADWA